MLHSQGSHCVNAITAFLKQTPAWTNSPFQHTETLQEGIINCLKGNVMSTDGGLVGTLIIRDLVRSTFLFINSAVYGIFITAKGDQNSLHIPFRVFLNQSPFLFLSPMLNL